MNTIGDKGIEASKYEAFAKQRLAIFKEAHQEIMAKLREGYSQRNDVALLALVKLLISNNDDIDMELAKIKDLKAQREGAAMESAQGLLDFELEDYISDLKQRCGLS